MATNNQGQTYYEFYRGSRYCCFFFLFYCSSN